MMTARSLAFLSGVLLGFLSNGPAASGQTSPPFSGFQGYGNVTTGGGGGDVYHVTSLADGGPGTLRDGIVNRSGPRRIVFDVAGTIALMGDLYVQMPYLTIDGASAPAPGITIHQNSIYNQFIIGGTHDIIISHLRFWGGVVPGGQVDNNAATLAIDGDSGPDHVAQRIVLDHLSLRNAADGGPDIWGEVRDVTFSWSFIFYNPHPMTVSHYPAPFQVRQRISVHHNVYAKNGERNPQIRADVRSFDFVNNIIYDWGYFGGGGYGIRIRNDAGWPKVHANLVNNYLIPKTSSPGWALVYGTSPGADSTDEGPASSIPQGTVVTTSSLGSLWVSGNILPPENRDHYSTVSAPLPVPEAHRVTTWPATELKTRILPSVGMKYRDAEERDILDELASVMVEGTDPVPPPPTNLLVH